ncbi:MAG: hypothetical protein RBT82_12590 [Desulfomonilia bacterium]|nr:hypothetical protein [Desulfomonilia bacterium]
MKEKIALFEHDLCGSKFFADVKTENPPAYMGRCPNPFCNGHVLTFAKELFPSTDYARRAYIKATKKDPEDVFWRTWESEEEKAV